MFPPSYQDVNRVITEKYLNYDSGFFIETGGADGYTQSNTWYLEMHKNWKGILVEPNPIAANICRNLRPNSSVFNYALVSDEYDNDNVTLLQRIVYEDDPGLMSSISDSPIRKNAEWIAPATEMDTTKEIVVQATTLNAILESINVDKIDFFSLDVEGYEIEVLKGIDLKRFCPKVMLIEWHSDIEDICRLVEYTHTFAEQLSKHDYVFVSKG